jgi:copper homeostasis protein
MSIKLEVCCGSVQDCLVAQKVKADRIELNSGLELGGLTPSLGMFMKARTLVDLPIMVMIRPHNGSYDYSELDFEVMKKDAKILLDAGSNGIVFGCLTPEGKIDEKRVKSFVELAKGKETVFHKAIDEIEDIEEGLEALIRCGITRVLIGGGQGLIDDHLDYLGQLQEKYGDKIQLLPGGGVHKGNLLNLLEKTHVSQIHMTGKRLETNPKTKTVHMVTDENTLSEVLKLIR